VHQKKVVSVAFSPDGARLVTASWDRTARVWDAATGTPITGALEHERSVTSAAFSPDGARIVTVSANTVMIWDASTGKPLTEPFLHQGKVVSAVFSPDGTRLVTASWDKTARVWDVRLDEGTLEQWSATAERSPFALAGSALVRRAPGTESKPAD
jgi:WD40 repeat protein